jgi:nucleoside-diphosphate-sugar epimerase
LTTKTVLVTGANGYIGRHVVQHLLDLGVHVIASDIAFVDMDPRAELMQTDIFTVGPDLDRVIEKTDICLHLAWRNGFNHNSETHIQDLPLHLNFIRHLLKSGVKHIGVIGSMHEIGYWEGVIDENTPANPTTLYGIAKNSLRQSINVITNNSDVVFQWLRAFYIVGDDLRNHSIFTKILDYERENKPTFPVTTGKNKFDFITIDELAEQISLSIIQEDVTGIINCCSGNPVSLRTQVEKFIEEHHLRIKPEFGVFPDRPYDSPGIWGDTQKISTIISNHNQAHRGEE